MAGKALSKAHLDKLVHNDTLSILNLSISSYRLMKMKLGTAETPKLWVTETRVKHSEVASTNIRPVKLAGILCRQHGTITLSV